MRLNEGKAKPTRAVEKTIDWERAGSGGKEGSECRGRAYDGRGANLEGMGDRDSIIIGKQSLNNVRPCGLT